MEKTPSIIGNASNQESLPQEAATDLGATILEMKREERKHTKRMAELAMFSEIQEKVIHRLLERAIEKPDQRKRPHLTVVK